MFHNVEPPSPNCKLGYAHLFSNLAVDVVVGGGEERRWDKMEVPTKWRKQDRQPDIRGSSK